MDPARHAHFAAVVGIAGIVAASLWFRCATLPAPGDISSALSPQSQRLHAVAGAHGRSDLQSFAYLRLPLVMAGDRVPDRRGLQRFVPPACALPRDGADDGGCSSRRRASP